MIIPIVIGAGSLKKVGLHGPYILVGYLYAGAGPLEYE